MKLFNYIKHLYVLKEYANLEDTKQEWCQKTNNEKFLGARAHPMFDSIAKKVAESSKMEILAT